MTRLRATSWVVMLLALHAAVAVAEDVDQGLRWLERVQAAPMRTNYTGVFVYQQGQSVQSSRITHLAVGGSSRERLEMLDGQPREFIRNNDEVRCLLPESRTVRVERSVQHETFPALIQSSAREIAEFYAVRRTGSERVAGRECDVLELVPRDTMRYGYRFWADRATGLPLKAQTINEKGEIVEQIAFSEIRIGGGIDRALLRSRWNTEGWKVESTVASSTPLTDWRIVSPVPGFKKVREMRRTLAGHPEVGQVVFSDGLAAVSIFIEPLREGRVMQEGIASKGAINMISRRYGDHWLTVLGEVPASSIQQFANAVEFQPSASKP